MSVESSSATRSHQAVAVAERKKTGKPDASAGAPATGFSMLLDMLAAAESPLEGLTEQGASSGDGVTAMPFDPDFDKNLPPALSDIEMVATNSEANLVESLPSATPPGSHRADQIAPATLAVAALATPVVPLGTVAAAPTASPAADAKPADLPGLTLDAQGTFQAKKPVAASLTHRADSEKNEALTKAPDTVMTAGAALPAPTEPPPPVKSAPRSQPANLTQADLKEPRSSAVLPTTPATPDFAGVAALAGLNDGSLRAQERAGAKTGSGRFGSGLEGLGASSLVNARADAPYQIEAASAAVPDTALAETVSYWVTHGVQSAELTLDGLGNEPVEVSISLNGDQAQIDFRTNQPEVRLVLEAATAELRELLSGEGLQLAGVSVGSSGADHPKGEAQQQKTPPRHVLQLPSEQAIGLQRSRGLNASMGQSLDLFV